MFQLCFVCTVHVTREGCIFNVHLLILGENDQVVFTEATEQRWSESTELKEDQCSLPKSAERYHNTACIKFIHLLNSRHGYCLFQPCSSVATY